MTMKHIVALSGGKDSTVMALRLAEVEPSDYEYVITPTGDELPEMYEHWKRLGALLGKPLKPITSGYSLQGLIRKWNALPNWRQRWCTRVLKIEPFNAYLMANLPATTYVGLRADEPEDIRRGTILGGVEGITQRYPLREWGWGINDVRLYLEGRGVSIPQRTDCARCFFQRAGEWYELWQEARARGTRTQSRLAVRRDVRVTFLPAPSICEQLVLAGTWASKAQIEPAPKVGAVRLRWHGQGPPRRRGWTGREATREPSE